MLEEGMFETVLWSGYYESLTDQLGLNIMTDLSSCSFWYSLISLENLLFA